MIFRPAVDADLLLMVEIRHIQRLAEMSAPYGTKITLDDRGYGIVELP